MANFNPLPPGADGTLFAATGGVADATVSSTNWQAMTLSFYAGQRVKLYSVGADVEYFFGATSTALPTTTSIAVPGVIPDRVFVGIKDVQTVPTKPKIWLRYRATGGTGNILRILRC